LNSSLLSEKSSQLSGEQLTTIWKTDHDYLENSSQLPGELLTTIWKAAYNYLVEQLATIGEQLTTIWRTACNYLTEKLTNIWRNSSQPSDGTAHNYLKEQFTELT
jgi:hypothetical protein